MLRQNNNFTDCLIPVNDISGLTSKLLIYRVPNLLLEVRNNNSIAFTRFDTLRNNFFIVLQASEFFQVLVEVSLRFIVSLVVHGNN